MLPRFSEVLYFAVVTNSMPRQSTTTESSAAALRQRRRRERLHALASSGDASAQSTLKNIRLRDAAAHKAAFVQKSVAAAGDAAAARADRRSRDEKASISCTPPVSNRNSIAMIGNLRYSILPKGSTQKIVRHDGSMENSKGRKLPEGSPPALLITWPRRPSTPSERNRASRLYRAVIAHYLANGETYESIPVVIGAGHTQKDLSDGSGILKSCYIVTYKKLVRHCAKHSIDG